MEDTGGGGGGSARVYLQFLCLASELKAGKFPALDPQEDRLLSQLAVAWYEGKTVTVTEAMLMSADMSPSTVHRRLKALRRKKVLMVREDESDQRRHYLVPTPTTESYFAALGLAMARAICR